MNKLVNYFKEAFHELKKITWPTKKETLNYTILVIAVSIGVAAFLGGLDWVFAKGVEYLINRQ
ncbi:MAG: preprotein translocase subunit SecE [Patescibacteria group bacterium]|nr:preprotein translocase subunit SecE [Patescibacteria group bacterium]